MTSEAMSDDDAFHVIMANADAMKRGALAIWTVYARPKDYPEGFIARLHEVAEGETIATDKTIAKPELTPIQEAFLKAGLVKLARDPSDEPQIVESWI
jgi:hypothetical protein